MTRKRKTYTYKVKAISRHSGQTNTRTISAHNMVEARNRVRHDEGKVISVKRIPSWTSSMYFPW